MVLYEYEIHLTTFSSGTQYQILRAEHVDEWTNRLMEQTPSYVLILWNT
jgi:hypothetical protein